MKTYSYARTGEKLYYDKTKNGLTVCVVPTTNKNSYYAILGVKYGSIDTEFIPVGKNEFIKSNAGVAHFLEHKAFEMENGEDPFAFFAKSGTNANASTSFLSTKYYIWGSNDFENNLDYLLKYVFSPYFTDENIKKEQGIIGEEIRMYEDDPAWFIDDLSRMMMFNELPIKEKIAGTYASISKITKEELYDCFNTFYVPNNMFLIVSGNVSYESVFNIVSNNTILKNMKSNKEIVRKKYQEQEIVHDEYKEVKMNIFIPKLKYSFKINKDKFSIKNRLKLDMYLNIITSLVFGSTSEFYEKVKKEDYATGYYVDHNYYDNYYTLEFDAESDKADLFKELVDEVINNIKINEKDLIRMKRVWIASEIKMSDSNDLIAENLLDDLICYNQIFPDRIEVIESLNMKELNKVIKELNFDNNCFILMNPKNIK